MVTATVGAWKFVADGDRLYWAPLSDPLNFLVVGHDSAEIVALWPDEQELRIATSDGAIWDLSGLHGTPETTFQLTIRYADR
jgi:hypothetical protein